MRQPAMRLRSLLIFLLLGLTVSAGEASARLTLGAAPGVTPGLESADRARQLARTLENSLGEEVAIRLFDTPQQIGQWLNQFDMLDLGVFDADYLRARPGEFLLLGPFTADGRLIVVARQGAVGDMPGRVTRALQRGVGRLPDAAKVDVAAPPPVASSAPSAAPPAVPADKPLTLGLIVGTEGVARTAADAERFATDLGREYGIALRPRVFENGKALADWYRFGMLDLAVIPRAHRGDLLAGDYQILSPLPRSAAPDQASSLLVARRELSAQQLQRFGQAAEAIAAAVPHSAPQPTPSAALPELPPEPPVPALQTVPIPIGSEPPLRPGAVLPQWPDELPAPDDRRLPPAATLPDLPELPIMPEAAVSEPTAPAVIPVPAQDVPLPPVDRPPSVPSPLLPP